MIHNIQNEPILESNTINNPRLHTKDYIFNKASENIKKPFTYELIKYIFKTIKHKCNHGIGIHMKLLLLLSPYIIHFMVDYLNFIYNNGLPDIHKLTYIKRRNKKK
eukprot:554952_1